MSENAVATRRGRKLPRDQRVRRLKRTLAALDPRFDDPKYLPLLTSFAQITLLSRDCYDYLRAAGLTNSDGEFRSSVDVFQRLTSAQLKLARELGLTPASLGKVKGERPIDLAAAFARKDEEHGDEAR